MVRLNLSSDDLENCDKTTAFVKERNPQCKVINKDFYLKNPNIQTSLEQEKLVKVLENYLKLEVVMNFK